MHGSASSPERRARRRPVGPGSGGRGLGKSAQAPPWARGGKTWRAVHVAVSSSASSSLVTVSSRRAARSEDERNRHVKPILARSEGRRILPPPRNGRSQTLPGEHEDRFVWMTNPTSERLSL